jgi:hypothetical protein
LLTGAIGFGRKSFWPNWDAPGNPGQYVSHYPTDITRDIVPIPCHSHNDYWRRIPLYEAIHYGCISIEADVWKFGDELFVGHSESSLTINRTFANLYINPLVEILNNQNPSNQFGKAENHGVFDEDANQVLVLLVDMKTDGRETFVAVQSAISPLREKGYLTYFNGNDLILRPIIVVGTGNTPFESIVENSTYRDIFFDAPLSSFSAKSPTIAHTTYNTTNSYYASTSILEVAGLPWRGRYSDDQIARLIDHIDGAHMVGLKARYWETPQWPRALRHYVWALLMQIGADILNVDDIYAASRGTWGKWGQ